ncbi:MAG: acetyl-CoA carboxylase biotin carboxylase subunit [Candidatus Hydrothermarchaeota archaeon]
MFNKILIANRGEIAIRIMGACKELDIKPVVVYSEPDKNSLHVRYAKEAYCIGESPVKSYLNGEKIIDTALKCGADAIHPGYGFLAENNEFARDCEKTGIVLIGPSSKVLKKMGDKVCARRIMAKAGVPLVPGTKKPIKDEEDALEIAESLGYPVVVKCVGCGGGRGIRIAKNEEELKGAIASARSEGMSSFGISEVYIEKYIEEPRHIEFQIVADKYGKIIHLGERDCSIQRRYQKLIEESPSPAINGELRETLGKLAVKGAKEAGYTNLGTVEFLMDKDKNFYFLEVNTRIQVEHPVTEMVTGVDLIKEQIRMAAGERIECDQEDIRMRGHSIQCRIYAEDPFNDFIPTPGTIDTYIVPRGFGVRLDSSVYEGYTILPYFDPMISKVIVWGRNRKEAIKRMRRALDEYIITGEGIKTTIPFNKLVMEDQYYREGNYSTSFYQQRIMPKLKKKIEDSVTIVAITAAISAYLGKNPEEIKISSIEPLDDVNEKV